MTDQAVEGPSITLVFTQEQAFLIGYVANRDHVSEGMVVMACLKEGMTRLTQPDNPASALEWLGTTIPDEENTPT